MRSTKLILCATLLALVGAGGVACIEADPVTTCTTDEECFQDLGYVCDVGETGFCLKSCTTSNDCLASECCDTTRNAVCRPQSIGCSGRTGGDTRTGDTN